MGRLIQRRKPSQPRRRLLQLKRTNMVPQRKFKMLCQEDTRTVPTKTSLTVSTSEELLSTDKRMSHPSSNSKESQRDQDKPNNTMLMAQPRRSKTLCQEDTRDLPTPTTSTESMFKELLTTPNLKMMSRHQLQEPQPNKSQSSSQSPTRTRLILTFHSLELPSTEM